MLTDGLPGTSPSVNNENEAISSKNESSHDTSMTPEVVPKVKGAYCKTKRAVRAYSYRTKKMEIAIICLHCSVDGCKEEWANEFENDGTPDNSPWTSIETDGILETSPSIDNVQMKVPSLDSQDNSETSVSILVDPRDIF